MNFKLLNFFQNKLNRKGIIYQYKLEKWWNDNFSKTEQDELIEILENVRDFGVSLVEDDNHNKSNLFTKTKSTFLTVTPFVYLLKPLQGINNQSYLFLKYIEAVNTLVDYYMKDDFVINDEIKRVIPENNYNEVIGLYKSGVYNMYTEIDYLYVSIISITYRLKKDSLFFDKCLEYSEKYFKNIEIYFNARKSRINAVMIATNSTNEESINNHLTNSALEKYIMLLQLLHKYDDALCAIDYFKKMGWKNDLSKRKSIIIKKMQKL